MRIKVILNIAGLICMALGLAMLIPLAVSAFFGDGDTVAFGISSAASIGIGGSLFFIFRSPGIEISHREGFLVVAVSWISASIVCALPYYISGAIPSVIDCLFEATSGITTTGASVLNNVESLPHGILFWRSFTHWLGGMGIIVLSVAILPLLGIGGMQLYKAEASTISGDKFVPRIKEMARILFIVYAVISFAMLVLLIIGGMGIYDSFIHMLGGVSTAGFSSKNASIAHFGSVYVEVVVMFFMILGGASFALHYGFFRKGLISYTKNEEFKFYLLMIALSTIILTICLKGAVFAGIGESLRYASFQAVSLITTTGYTSADYGNWPVYAQLIILCLMFIGGSAGSTTGAIKCVRVLLILKLVYKEIYKLIHPHAVIPVKLAGKAVPIEILRSVLGFSALFILAFIISAILLSFTGLDFMT
ncbi:MAG: TrkH family potassium uptake protein, partial [Deltaproteobacteria bacterium]|nr:TrkH family potassium uptake protein [Deltaproteobacteria bacterium]